jgi:hypothetical protein
MPVPLVQLRGVSDEKLQALQNYCCDKFWQSVQTRNNQVSGMYQRWLDNYAGKPLQPIRTTPFYKASNFVPQLIRMHTDISASRILNFIFATKPLWKPKTFVAGLGADVLNAVGEWMDNICLNGMNFYEPIDMTIFLAFKCGTQVTKALWVDEQKFVGNGKGGVNAVRKEYCDFDVVPFDDFFPYPVTARTLEQTIANFHRLRFAKEEIEYRKSIGLWDNRACELLLRGGDKPSEGNPRLAEASNAGISLTVDVTRPFNAVEGWVCYQLEPGKLYSLCVTFNPYSRTRDGILRAVYDYTPNGMGVFNDFRFLPRENLFWGYSIPEILEQSQEEKAQIHNARRDSNIIANVPGWKKKRLADVGSPSQEWYPGKVFEVDNMEDLEPLAMGVNYNAMMEEEAQVDSEAERYTGISPPMQGFGAGTVGKKGIYSSMGTMALLSEGNKRMDIYLKRLRRPFHRTGAQIFSSYRDYKSNAPEYQIYGANGDLLKQAFSVREPDGFRGLFFDLGASDASANKEVDRQNLLLMANTMAAYYQQIMGLIPAVVQAPPDSPFKELGLQILDGARDLANRILFAFDVYDRSKLLPDIRKLLGGEQPPPRPEGLDQAGVPQAEEPLSVGGLQDLSESISKVAGGFNPQTTPANLNTGRVV